MATHQFIHEESGEIIEVRVPTDAPIVQHQRQEIDGKVYKRVYSAPLAAKDTRFGDCSATDFRRKTTDKAGLKVGDMWEISAEMSERRKQRQGHDPVLEQHYANHEKEYGEKHPDVVKRERQERLNERMKEWGIKVNL